MTFHNGLDFKPTCMSSGHKGQGWPSLQPCLTLLGTVSSPWAFPVTLGSPAVVASWPHRRVGPGTQSWWRCCRYLCVTLGRSLHPLSPLFPLRKTGDSTSSPPHRSAGTAHHNPWGQRPQREGTAGERGTAPRSRGFLRAQNRVSCLPITRRSHEPGQILVFQSCPAPAVAPTPYGTETLPVRQQQRRLRAGTQLHVYSQTLAEVIQG